MTERSRRIFLNRKLKGECEVRYFLNVNIILIIYCPTVNIILYCQTTKNVKSRYRFHIIFIQPLREKMSRSA